MEKLLNGVKFFVEIGPDGGCFYESEYVGDDPISICEHDTSPEYAINEILAHFGKSHINLEESYQDPVQVTLDTIVQLGGIIEDKLIVTI